MSAIPIFSADAYVSWLGELDLRSGRVAEAEARLGEAAALLGADHGMWSAACLGAIGEARVARDRDGGTGDLDRAIALARAGGWRLNLAEALCRRARALNDPGALREAERIADAMGVGERSRVRMDLARTAALLDLAGHNQP